MSAASAIVTVASLGSHQCVQSPPLLVCKSAREASVAASGTMGMPASSKSGVAMALRQSPMQSGSAFAQARLTAGGKEDPAPGGVPGSSLQPPLGEKCCGAVSNQTTDDD